MTILVRLAKQARHDQSQHARSQGLQLVTHDESLASYDSRTILF